MLSAKYYHRKAYGFYADAAKQAKKKLDNLVEEWQDLKRKIATAKQNGDKKVYWKGAYRKVRVNGAYKTCTLCIGYAEVYEKEWEQKVKDQAAVFQQANLSNTGEEIAFEGPDAGLSTGWDSLAVDPIDIPNLEDVPLYDHTKPASILPAGVIPVALGGSALLLVLYLIRR